MVNAPLNNNDLRIAFDICHRAHREQTDDDGMPHALHCIRVMLNVPSIDQKVLALLHDVIEDGGARIPWKELHESFPVSLLHSLTLLSKFPNEPYDLYIDRILRSNDLDAAMVKIADINDNLARMTPRYEKHRTRYLRALKLLTLHIENFILPSPSAHEPVAA